MPAAINCLIMIKTTYLMAGLESGEFAGWNLETNSIDLVKLHQAPVTKLYKYDQVLISGDA